MELPVLIGIAGLLLVALLLEPLASRLRVPFATLLVVAGFVASEIIVGLGVDTGLRWYHFHDLVFHLLLPILIFESSLNLPITQLRRNLIAILMMAVPGVLLAAGITAVLLFLGIGHPHGFPWITALLAGAILSATDPVAVVAVFRQLGVPERLTVLLEGESLFNDATAIVLYAVLLPMTLTAELETDWLSAGLQFSRVFVGDLLTGAAGAVIVRLLLPVFQNATPTALFTVASTIMIYHVAENWLHVSGILAVLVTGLVVGEQSRRSEDDFVLRFWSLNAYWANALVFVLAGVTVTIAMFEERWLAMLIGIGAVLVTRAGLSMLILPGLSRFGGAPLPAGYGTASFWGGLRGGVTLALALALPLELATWWDIQSIAYGVVLFSLLVQAPTMPWMARHLGLARSRRQHET